MKIPAPEKLIPAAVGLLAVVLLFDWLWTDVEFEPRLPGGDKRPAAAAEDAGAVKIAGQLTAFDGKPSAITETWPRFRGENFDATGKSEVALARSWPEEGPPVVWSIEVGEGFAGAAVFAGRVYLLDYDRQNKADVIRCLSLDDGKDIWRYSYPVKTKRWHGMSRTVPAVTEKYVVTIGPKCHVTCLDSATGEFRWMYNLVREFGTKVPQWYTAQCPLIDDGKAIIAPAGDEVLMIAVDCETGEIAWKTPNPDKWSMTHSSIVPMESDGKRFYVYSADGGVVGVWAVDGTVLWKYTDWHMQISAPSPVVIGPDRIFLMAGYGQYDLGCTMLRLTVEDGKIAARQEFLHDTKVFGSMQQTPIFYNGHIYGVGMDKKVQLACLDLEGNVLWSSTSANKFGHGPYVIADDMIYAMDDDGLLRIVEASPNGYTELDRAQVLEGPESWGPMAVVSGRLILRDVVRMICLDISAR